MLLINDGHLWCPFCFIQNLFHFKELQELRVYHGSNVKVEFPNAEFGRKNLDFGPGFYVTEIKEQVLYDRLLYQI